MKEGDKVIYQKELKGLPINSIGVIKTINDKMASIVYPQFLPTKKGESYSFTNYVYAHSALLSDLKIVNFGT